MKAAQILTTWDGRIGRREYLLKGVLPLLSVYALYFTIGVSYQVYVSLTGKDPVGHDLIVLVYVILGFLCACSLYAVAAKRLRDFGRSGWWALILTLPIVLIGQSDKAEALAWYAASWVLFLMILTALSIPRTRQTDGSEQRTTPSEKEMKREVEL